MYGISCVVNPKFVGRATEITHTHTVQTLSALGGQLTMTAIISYFLPFYFEKGVATHIVWQREREKTHLHWNVCGFNFPIFPPPFPRTLSGYSFVPQSTEKVSVICPVEGCPDDFMTVLSITPLPGTQQTLRWLMIISTANVVPTIFGGCFLVYVVCTTLSVMAVNFYDCLRLTTHFRIQRVKNGQLKRQFRTMKNCPNLSGSDASTIYISITW